VKQAKGGEAKYDRPEKRKGKRQIAAASRSAKTEDSRSVTMHMC
jgi:hypothetical protein